MEGNYGYFIWMLEGVRIHTGKIQWVFEGILFLIHLLNIFICQNIMSFIVIE